MLKIWYILVMNHRKFVIHMYIYNIIYIHIYDIYIYTYTIYIYTQNVYI